MKKRILAYTAKIDALLAGGLADTDVELLRREHLTQIGFFQHERAMHLSVMLAFALMELLSLGMLLQHGGLAMQAMCVLFAILLVPYISHYYLLENQVQKMYEQYDRIEETYDNLRRHTEISGNQDIH